jgi:hypothetical protein
MDVTVYAPGCALPASTLTSVHELFRACYYRYHYLSELASLDRLKVVATSQGQVRGYASASRYGELYRLANLLVHPGSRGIGLGRRLERVRHDHVRREGLSCYVSCTCDETTSQALKLSLGMRPVAFKIGFRNEVLQPGERGSAVVYTDASAAVTEPVRESMTHSTALRRARYVAAHPESAVLDALPADDYAEVLTGARGLDRMAGRPGFRFAGLDYVPVSAQWCYCFQACNEAYQEGLRQRPAVAAMPTLGELPASLEVTA